MQRGSIGSALAARFDFGARLGQARDLRVQKEREDRIARNFNLARSAFIRGAERRQAILDYLSSSPSARLAVNKRWQLQTRYDDDLARLIKQGKLKLM